MVVSNFQHFKKVSFSFALFFHFNFISPNESFQQHCFKIRYSLHLNEAQSKAELLYIMVPKKEHSLSVEDVHHGPSSQALSQYSRQEAALTPVQPRGCGRQHTSSQCHPATWQGAAQTWGLGMSTLQFSFSHTHGVECLTRGKAAGEPDPEAP